MEKRRVRLVINGVVCGLITRETEEYMQTLADEVGGLMTEIMAASPLITREAAALTAALSICDDCHKNADRAAALSERMEELEVAAEIWQEEKVELLKSNLNTQKDVNLSEKAARLESENARLESEMSRLEEDLDRLSGVERDIQALREENETLRRAASAPSHREQTLESENAHLESEMSRLESENARLEEDLDKLSGVERDVQALREENETLRRAASAPSHREQTLESENAHLRESLEKLSGAAKGKEDAARLAEQRLQEVLALQARIDQLTKEPQDAPAAKDPQEAPKPAPRRSRHRKNPLYQDDSGMEQEGFQSFFALPDDNGL